MMYLVDYQVPYHTVPGYHQYNIHMKQDFLYEYCPFYPLYICTAETSCCIIDCRLYIS